MEPKLNPTGCRNELRNSTHRKTKNRWQHNRLSVAQLQNQGNTKCQSVPGLENLHVLTTQKEAAEAIRKRIPVKHRKDAVLCIEYMITASPEFLRKVAIPKPTLKRPMHGYRPSTGQKM